MKKISIVGGIILIASLFSGCAYKQECGVDDCGRHYIDTTYRQYTNDNECSQIGSNCQKPVEKLAEKPALPKDTPVLKSKQNLKISVVGEGVAPCQGACSPAQSRAMAKRAAIADAYRLLAEKINGVFVQGDDYVRNLALRSSTVRTHVAATVRNANILDTTFKDGMAKVEMEVSIAYSDFANQ